MMPVIDLALRYKKPARYDDVLDIYTRIRKAPRTRIRIEYDVQRTGERDVLVQGHVSLCFFDVSRNRPTVAPPSLAALFERALAV